MALQQSSVILQKRLCLSATLTSVSRYGPVQGILSSLQESLKLNVPCQCLSSDSEQSINHIKSSAENFNKDDQETHKNLANHKVLPVGNKHAGKVKTSHAARKFFKESFLQHHASLQGDEKDLLTDDNLLSSFKNDDGYKQLKDERDPNERLDDIMPEEADQQRDRRLNIPLTRDGRRGRNAYYYNRKMSVYERQGKIKEAIGVFDHWMMVRDRVMPRKKTFVVLIGILGRVGYTEKAFEIYRQMRNLGLDAEPQIYTSLFNACANSPWPKQHLKSAENLLNALQEKGIPLNLTSVKAAVKALAVCGNFPRAFALMDDAAQRLGLDTECFDHLLMACIADKKAGFCRALQVWKKMQEYNIQPESNTYNLLIRSARDCSIGDPDIFASVLGVSSGSMLLPPNGHLSPGQGFDLLSKERIALPGAKFGSSKQTLVSGDKPSNLEKDFALLAGLPHDLKSECVPQISENHNLYHDIPNFDKDIDEFIMQRNATREQDSYEWWEAHPDDKLCIEDHYSLQLEESALTLSDSSMTEYSYSSVIMDPQPHSLNGGDKKDVSVFPKNSACSAEETDHKLCDSLTEVSEQLSGLSVKDITTSSQRLALLGGARRLIAHMMEGKTAPDVRTFSQLVACLPSTAEAESDLLSMMEEVGVKPDVDLINDIMMKRNLRHNSDTVKELLPIMSKLGLVPNMRTYAALALTCFSERQAWALLEDMEAANLEPSEDVMGHFIYISRGNFSYKLHMLQHLESLCLSPMPHTIRVIEKSIAVTKKQIIDKERKKDYNSHYLSDGYQRSFQRFLNFYNGWLRRTSIHQPSHPWKAFQHIPKSEEDVKLDEGNEDNTKHFFKTSSKRSDAYK